MIEIQDTENLKTYALVKESKVFNLVVWDGESEFTPEEELVEVPAGITIDIGFDYVDGDFVDNRPKPELPEL